MSWRAASSASLGGLLEAVERDDRNARGPLRLRLGGPGAPDRTPAGCGRVRDRGRRFPIDGHRTHLRLRGGAGQDLTEHLRPAFLRRRAVAPVEVGLAPLAEHGQCPERIGLASGRLQGTRGEEIRRTPAGRPSRTRGPPATGRPAAPPRHAGGHWPGSRRAGPPAVTLRRASRRRPIGPVDRSGLPDAANAGGSEICDGEIARVPFAGASPGRPARRRAVRGSRPPPGSTRPAGSSRRPGRARAAWTRRTRSRTLPSRVASGAGSSSVRRVGASGLAVKASRAPLRPLRICWC